MSRSKLIVVEGPQGAGKTTITDYIRYSLKHTNLYRLAGISDSTPAGYQKSKDMYDDLMEYTKKMENKDINLLFDRTFFTEENYCRLGLKEYSFTDAYNDLLEKFSKLDFDIYYITLYLEDENLYEERLKRDNKAVFAYSKFSCENSKNQQRVYLEMSDEIEQKYSNIKVLKLENSRPLEEVQKELRAFLNY